MKGSDIARIENAKKCNINNEKGELMMKNEKKKILMVDDDKSILRVYERIFQKEGYVTAIAETGREATEKTGKEGFDVALIDVKLPDVNGIELLKRFNSKNPKMVKIVITGLPSIDDGVKALDEGADAYLVKPVESKELIKLIREKLEKRDKS